MSWDEGNQFDSTSDAAHDSPDFDSSRPIGPVRGVRKRSAACLLGLPLYEIATGPDPQRGQRRGHARAIFAVGDIATGVVAIGGLARGGLALGGVALGVVAFGGCAIGLLAALGGLAIGALAFGGGAVGLLAVGGGAVGLVAVGGGAVGYYACGAGACGKYVISVLEQSPEAVKFFEGWVHIGDLGK